MNKSKFRLFLILGLWFICLAFGFWRLNVFDTTPGKAASDHHLMPQDKNIVVDPKMATLILFAHPLCSCSAASIAEIERLIPDIQNKIKTYVVFVKPLEETEDWTKERLWKTSKSIPYIETLEDVGGQIARKFGAETSGQAFLYNQKGQLLFSGGITPMRGHQGDSFGRDAILEFINARKITKNVAAVFGCALVSQESAEPKRVTK